MALETNDIEEDAANVPAFTGTHTVVRSLPLAVAPTATEDFNTVRVPLAPVACGRLNDHVFAFNSSFPDPILRENLGKIRGIVEANPGSPASIFGHADPVGDDEFNKQLSGRRAEAIYALLTRDVTLWKKLYHGGIAGDIWVYRTVEIMLSVLVPPASASGVPYYDGPNDGNPTQKARQAISSFQTDHGVPRSGVPDDPTLDVIFPLYMEFLCGDFVMPRDAFLGKGKGAHGKADYQGCSELNPVFLFSKADLDRLANKSDKTERNQRNLPNRRVMLFLFRPGTTVSLSDWPCPEVNEGTGKCKKQFWPDGEMRRKNGADEREYRVTRDTMACRFYDRFARRSPCEGGAVVETLESRYPLDLCEKLADGMLDHDFVLWAATIFGSDIPETAYRLLWERLRARSMAMPEIFLATTLQDASGSNSKQHHAAYDSTNRRILVLKSTVRRAANENEMACVVMLALLEEFGHHVDVVLRNDLADPSKTGKDGPQDEGAVMARACFAYAFVGMNHAETPVTEFALHRSAGKSTVLAAHLDDLHTAARKYLSDEELRNDAKSPDLEFFGAGFNRGTPHRPLISHGDIELSLATAHPYFGDHPERIRQVYFGNWLRDFSQVITPVTISAVRGLSLALQLTPRDVLTALVDLGAVREFKEPNGTASSWALTTNDRLGVYLPVEHIDNPTGFADERGKLGPPFRGPCLDNEVAIDPATGILAYIATDGQGFPTSQDYAAKSINEACTTVDSAERHRLLGQALHTIEDLFAHSNFVELVLIAQGDAVYPWVGANRKIKIGAGRRFPLVTGSFGVADTVVSLLEAIAEWLATPLEFKKGSTFSQSTAACLRLRSIGTMRGGEALESLMACPTELFVMPEAAKKLMFGATHALRDSMRKAVGGMMTHFAEQVTKHEEQVSKDDNMLHPTHSMLAKDHAEHPLHQIAAECARIATMSVGSAVASAWTLGGPATVAQAVSVARGIFIHPADIPVNGSATARRIWSAIVQWASAHRKVIDGDLSKEAMLLNHDFRLIEFNRHATAVARGLCDQDVATEAYARNVVGEREAAVV